MEDPKGEIPQATGGSVGAHLPDTTDQTIKFQEQMYLQDEKSVDCSTITI